MRLVHGSGATGLQLVQSISDSDEDSDGAWEGRLGHRYDPPGNRFFFFFINIFTILPANGLFLKIKINVESTRVSK